eukprot:2183787-Pyramimonas_sp.AAC.1
MPLENHAPVPARAPNRAAGRRGAAAGSIVAAGARRADARRGAAPTPPRLGLGFDLGFARRLLRRRRRRRRYQHGNEASLEATEHSARLA